MMDNLYTLENEVFSAFAFYTATVLFKMMLVSYVTTYYRLSKKIFSYPEDVKTIDPKDGKLSLNDPDVERSRGCHRNDMENIPVFVLLGLLYIATNPTPGVAIWHFRIFVASRLVHTVALQFLHVLRVRTYAFMIGQIVCGSFLVQIVTATWQRM